MIFNIIFGFIGGSAIAGIIMWFKFLLKFKPLKEPTLPDHPAVKLCGSYACPLITCHIRADQFKVFKDSKNSNDLIQDAKPDYYIWMKS